MLNTIGGDGQQTQLPPSQLQSGLKPPVDIPEPSGKSTPRIVVPQSNAANSSQKRKAEDIIPAPTAKALKVEAGQGQANDPPSPAGGSSLKKSARPSISTSKSALTVPYRGTSRPSPTSASPITPNADASRPAPKKGSYAEIMARASANNKPSIGVIKHKPKEAVSAKKEILMRKKGMLPRAKIGNKNERNGTSGQDRNSPLPSPANPKGPGSTHKKVPQLSYKGTATPKPQPAYKGTMKTQSSIADTARRKDSRNDRSRSSSTKPLRRDREYESEDEEDGIEEEEEIYSDESDDMEAGFSDVEEEETAASKAARKEDEEQMRIENQLKKEKEERRKRLAAMAAKAPKPKY